MDNEWETLVVDEGGLGYVLSSRVWDSVSSRSEMIVVAKDILTIQSGILYPAIYAVVSLFHRHDFDDQLNRSLNDCLDGIVAVLYPKLLLHKRL